MYKFDINVYESIYEIYYITLIKSSLYFRVDEMDFNFISLLYLYTDILTRYILTRRQGIDEYTDKVYSLQVFA